MGRSKRRFGKTVVQKTQKTGEPKWEVLIYDWQQEKYIVMAQYYDKRAAQAIANYVNNHIKGV